MIGALRKHTLGEPVQAKPKNSRKYTESNAQKRVVAWIRERPNWMVVRVENAQKRTMGAAIRDKQLGLHTGAPDLIVMYRKHLLWLEMKAIGGRLSDDQCQCHAELRNRGQMVMVGFGHRDTILKLEAFAAMCEKM